MAVCTTCHQPGLTLDQPHDCPGPQYADIKFTRHQGQAITVDEAPAHARLDIRVLGDRYAYLHMPEPGTIVFADQVVYRITGYDTGSHALELELAEDWRPAATPSAPEPSDPAAAYQEMRKRWQEAHGNGEPQVVTKVEAKEEA